MKVETVYTFDYNEIRNKLRYDLINDTMGSPRWGTCSVKRKLQLQFTEEERAEIKDIFSLVKRWRLSTGLPNSVSMSLKRYRIWKRLIIFCWEAYH